MEFFDELENERPFLHERLTISEKNGVETINMNLIVYYETLDFK